ncbi:MAG: hypothetical protein V3U27_21330 [Candidatus Tectomicrobia bacterium]
MAYPATLQIDYAAPYETGGTQLYPIGQKAESTDGSIYRYTLMGSTIGIANNLYQAAVPTNNWLSQTHTIEATAGDTSISFEDGGTTFTVNQAAGGTVLFEETDDLGGIYRIKSNTATAVAETIMQFEDGVTVQTTMAVAASNVMTFLLNPWSATIVVPTTTPTAIHAGIPRVIIAASAYGWLQTRGVASCLIIGVVVKGNPVITAGTTAGSVGPPASQTTTITTLVGQAMEVAPTADFGHIFLTLE